jgi:hypothetical protein
LIAIQKPAEVIKIANPIPLEENFGSPATPIPKRVISCDVIIAKPARKSIPPKARIAIVRFDGHRKAAAIVRGNMEQAADIKHSLSGTCRANINGARARKSIPAIKLVPPAK